MEREPLEPAVLAVELFQEESRQSRRHLSLAWVAVACAALGGLTVYAYLTYAPKVEEAPSSLVVNLPSNQKAEEIASSLYSPLVKDPSEPPKTDPPVAPSATEAKPTENPVTPPPSNPSGRTPFNPLAGNIVSTGEVPPGWDPSQGPRPDLPTTGPAPAQEPERKANAMLLTGRKGGGDPEAEATEVAAKIIGAGGSVTVALHYNMAGGVVGANVVATLPSSAAASVSSSLGIDIWKGTSEDRQSRASGMLASRIRDLKSVEEQLKVKYEDDATEVSLVREEIQKLNQGLSMVRGGKSAGIAIVVIGIGSL